jgi:hypothetical protein
MHWRIIGRGIKSGQTFMIIFSPLISLGIAHLINIITSRKTYA